MSSRRIQAMAKLIEEIAAQAEAIKCTESGPCRCSILLLIGEYKNQFKTPKAEGPTKSES